LDITVFPAVENFKNHQRLNGRTAALLRDTCILPTDRAVCGRGNIYADESK